MKKTFSFTFQGKKYNIKDYDICDNVFSRARGLMFRGKNYKKPLLFVWKKPVNLAIHSFFCQEFLAIWYLDKKVIDVAKVKPGKFSITPKGKFNLLLETPLKYFEIRRG